MGIMAALALRILKRLSAMGGKQLAVRQVMAGAAKFWSCIREQMGRFCGADESHGGAQRVGGVASRTTHECVVDRLANRDPNADVTTQTSLIIAKSKCCYLQQKKIQTIL